MPSKTSRPLIRILVAEDHTIVRDGIVALLSQEPGLSVVAQASNGREAVKLWEKQRPDVALMDLQLPELDGISAIRQVRSIDPDARIIVLTTYDGDEDIYQAVRAGARAYLLKDVRREELFRAVREVHAGKILLPPAVASKLASRLPSDELTAREMDVLRLLAKGKPNKLIAADLSITEVTVKTHVQALFRKLNVLSRTEALAAANRRGLIRF